MASKLVFIAGLAIVPTGCFTGADAKGLPCNADLDCGVDDRCIDGYCGGAPATATTIDPTTESSSSSSTSVDPTTGDLPCDNPAWQCVPVMPGVPDENCDGDCTDPRCGDNVLNEPAGEQCDDGVDNMPTNSEECDYDCTFIACGDGVINTMAGTEGCEDDDPLDDFDGCTADCQVPAVMETFNLSDGAWTSVPYDLSSYRGDPEWGNFTDVDTSGWTWNGSAWTSGAIPYFGVQPMTDQRNYAATTRLVSAPFDLPDAVPPGFRLELHFEHSMSIESEGCTQDPARNGDGGVVRLLADSDDILTPEGGYMDIDGICVMSADPEDTLNPLDVENDIAFTGELDGPVVVDLTEHLGRTDVQLVFEFGLDCVHCVDPNIFSPSVWTIDDVIVAAYPN